MQTVSSILRQVSVEALLHGNVTLSDAKDTEQVLEHVMTSPTSSVLPGEKFPKETLIQLPLSSVESHTIVAPTKEATESNTAVEVYFQVRLLQNSCFGLVLESKSRLMSHLTLAAFILTSDFPVGFKGRSKEEGPCGFAWADTVRASLWSGATVAAYIEGVSVYK